MSCVGLVPVMALAEQAGLEALISERVGLASAWVASRIEVRSIASTRTRLLRDPRATRNWWSRTLLSKPAIEMLRPSGTTGTVSSISSPVRQPWMGAPRHTLPSSSTKQRRRVNLRESLPSQAP